jgi:nicotinate phosphoribosyltransferase
VTTTGLLTDHYELTMICAAIEGGTAHRRAIFEMFARQLPPGRRYGVVAGTGRFLDALANFRFSPADLDFLHGNGVIDERSADYLASYRFGGNIWGYAEGDCYFPGSPILVVDGTFAETVILETLALSVFNHDCAVASAASRMVNSAGHRPVIEMGSRRTHELAAVAAARAAYLAGFNTSSNLRAGQEYGVPTAGTSAHAFTMVHDNERQAFEVQLESLGVGTTLLVDTYDVPAAVKTAVELAGSALGAVRIDSGDVAEVAAGVRAQLDELGATHTKIVVTGDLDEYSIADLATAPVDGYGVGTRLVTGSGAPTASLVYKLVARSAGVHRGPRPLHPPPATQASTAGSGSAARDEPVVPVAKRSVGKPTMGGRKWAMRSLDSDGVAISEAVIVSDSEPSPRPGLRPLMRHLVRDGEIIGAEPLTTARQRHQRVLDELPAHAKENSPGGPAIPTIFEVDPTAQRSSGIDS